MRSELGIELTYLRVDTRTEGNACWSIPLLQPFFWPIGKASKNNIFWHRTNTSKMADTIDPCTPRVRKGLQKVNC